MNIDQDYLKHLINTFRDSPRSFVDLRDFRERQIPTDDKFLFHMQLLEDRKLVECLNKDTNLGYSVALGGNFEWMSRPLRLTADGHEFAEALNRREVWEVLKSGFKDASLTTLTSAAKELLVGFIKKQVKKHFEP